jgi:hypothetical protein
MELAFHWGCDASGAWHRISGVPSVGGVNTLCGRLLSDIEGTSTQPPPEGASRCHACEIEGEAAPPNH